MSELVECRHCGGHGSCNCDACYAANDLDPEYRPGVFIPKVFRNSVPCKVCGGSGKTRV